MPSIETSSSILGPVLERTGVLAPAILFALVLLVLFYPDRPIGVAPYQRHLPILPNALPLIGHTGLMLSRGTARQHDYILEGFEGNTVGVMQSSVLGLGKMHMVVRPEYLEAVQRGVFDNFRKGDLFRERFQDVLGAHGIFVADGETWKTQRKRASNIFSAGQFRTWVQTTVQGELSQVIGLLDAVAAQKKGYNKLVLTELFFRYTLSSFVKMAFSADLDCLSEDPSVLDRPVPFATAFDFAQGVINERFINPFFKLTELLSPKGAKMRAARRQLRSTGLEIISDRIERRRVEEAEGGRKAKAAAAGEKDGKDLLDLFLDITQDPEDLLVVVMNFLIAGRDTTAQTLSWLYWELFENPELVPRIVEEIESVYGPPPTDGKPYMMAYDDIKRLPFLQACFAEATRLHPAVPKNGKICCEDVVLKPTGPDAKDLPSFEVKRGEWVGWSDFAMNRRKDVWGEDAADFKPDRFISTDEKTGERSFVSYSQWKFHTFNGGPRLCLGQTLAYYEGMSMLVSTLPRYNFSWASKEQGQTADYPLGYLNSVTLPSQPYVAFVKRR